MGQKAQQLDTSNNKDTCALACMYYTIIQSTGRTCHSQGKRWHCIDAEWC